MVSISQGSSSSISNIPVSSSGQSGNSSSSLQIASSANFAASPLAGNMDSLLNIVTQLLKLLGKRPQPSPSGGKTLRGSRDDDTLNGTEKNDRIYGRDGNDTLNGNGGNDRLYGEAGNDTLRGGEGDDYLEDNQGSNTFFGGSGNDTMSLQGKLADYDVSAVNFIAAPGPEYENGIVLTNKRSGEQQTVFSVENFQFSDGTRSIKELLNQGNTDPARQDYENNLQKWQGSDLENYSFTLQRNCFCRGDAIRPVNIEVENGKVKSAVFADTGEPLPADVDFNSLTVDDLFKQIGEAFDSGAEKVDVKYDPTYGYPTSIYIDRSSMIADEEVGFTISNFVNNDEPTFTTLAVGEEDGGGIGTPLPKPEPPIFTTQAFGEEDNGGDPVVIDPPVKEPPTVTTLALGEEDGGIIGIPVKQ